MGLATRADAAEIKRFLSAFLGVNVPIAKMRARIDDTNIITAIIHGLGYCQVKVREHEQSVKVEALFPRDEKIQKLRPVLQQALREVLVRWPDSGSWRVWAQFWDPKGKDGRFDNGKGEVRAWAAAYPPGLVDVVRPTKIGEAWTGESTIGRMLAA